MHVEKKHSPRLSDGLTDSLCYPVSISDLVFSVLTLFILNCFAEQLLFKSTLSKMR